MDSEAGEAKPSDVQPASLGDQRAVDAEQPSDDKVTAEKAEDKNMDCS